MFYRCNVKFFGVDALYDILYLKIKHQYKYYMDESLQPQRVSFKRISEIEVLLKFNNLSIFILVGVLREFWGILNSPILLSSYHNCVLTTEDCLMGNCGADDIRNIIFSLEYSSISYLISSYNIKHSFVT